MKLNQLAGLRGICAWWVVLYHSLSLMDNSVPGLAKNILSHGYLAVDLFFLLSGFVIFLSYHSSLTNQTPHGIGKFYWNRLSRIYPLHIVMLGAYLLLFGAFIFFSNSGSAPDTYTWSSFFQSMFLIHMWVGSDLAWNVPSWSISSEWFVYLFFPIMAYSLRKLRGNVAVHLFAIVLLAALVHLVYSVAGLSSLGLAIPRMALVRTMLEFLMGVFIGSLFVHHKAFLQRYSLVALGSFLALCSLYATTLLPDHAPIPLAFAFLIAYLSISSSWIVKALSTKPLVYLGEISYSTYMVHYLVYDVLKAGFVSPTYQVDLAYVWVSFAVVLVLSVLLHHGVDMPSQRFFRRRLPARPAPLQASQQ